MLAPMRKTRPERAMSAPGLVMAPMPRALSSPTRLGAWSSREVLSMLLVRRTARANFCMTKWSSLATFPPQKRATWPGRYCPRAEATRSRASLPTGGLRGPVPAPQGGGQALGVVDELHDAEAALDTG